MTWSPAFGTAGRTTRSSATVPPVAISTPDKLHALHHKGKHFSVRGPLNVARPPQGYPIVAQAGSSEPGRALAARTADVVFTAQVSLQEAQAFYADVKGRMALLRPLAGRYPHHAGHPLRAGRDRKSRRRSTMR